jgi:hypothetical protein
LLLCLPILSDGLVTLSGKRNQFSILRRKHISLFSLV